MRGNGTSEGEINSSGCKGGEGFVRKNRANKKPGDRGNRNQILGCESTGRKWLIWPRNGRVDRRKDGGEGTVVKRSSPADVGRGETQPEPREREKASFSACRRGIKGINAERRPLYTDATWGAGQFWLDRSSHKKRSKRTEKYPRIQQQKKKAEALSPVRPRRSPRQRPTGDENAGNCKRFRNIAA